MMNSLDWKRKFLFRIGDGVLTGLDYVGSLCLFSAQTFAWLPKPLVRHHRITELMIEIGIRTLPVSGLILFLIGMVIAFQTAYQVQNLGGEVLIPPLLAVSMTRELAPVLASFVTAGRVGAAITAELGSMRVSEQIDAVETLAVPPIRALVVPRFWAMLTMAPILTLYTALLGLVGGWLVCAAKLGIDSAYFIDAALEALVLEDVLSCLVKSIIFGALVCLVSCFEGMRVTGGAQGVGRSTMNAVVVSFLLIVLADFFFTVFFYVMPF